jgi:hypothetical protein
MAPARRCSAVLAAVLLWSWGLGGCSAIVSNVSADLADNLSAAILNQDDPELVREALPSYLLLLDSLVEGSPDSPATLAAAAQLYAAYGAALVNDPDRARILTARARDYGARALCAAERSACGLDALRFDDYAVVIRDIDERDVEALYSYSLGTLAFIRSNADDFGALASLPKVELALQQVMALEPGDLAASTCMYLGILNTLRPASLGGQPEAGRNWFERAIELSEGKDLSVKVEFARGYARLVYDRELHDRLLNDVLSAEVEQPDLTLFNLLAQSEARDLLLTADDYF